MKKIVRKIVLVGLGLVGLQQVQAQNTEDRKEEATIGIKGGINLANFHTNNNDIDDQDMISGVNLGILMYLPLSRKVILQPEVNYTTKGSAVSYNNVVANGIAQFRLRYLEVPVLLRYNLNKHAHVHAGPYAAYLLDSRIINKTENGDFDFNREINKDDLNSIDWGLAAGVGVDMGSLGVGLRYNYGMATIGQTKTYGTNSYTFPDAKNSNLSLYVSLKF
ncbi:MAG: porin family protein [Cytophagales bacterium]